MPSRAQLFEQSNAMLEYQDDIDAVANTHPDFAG
jgi:hypothetical protein